MRGLLFDLSCEIIISSHELNQDEQTARWSWLLQTCVHWHPVAYLLSEICAGLQGEKLRKAWNTINIGMADYHGLSDKGNENLWRPLRGLFERAKSATPQEALADITTSLSDPFAGVQRDNQQPEAQDDFLDQNFYRPIPAEESTQDSQQDNSIWNLNDYTVQHTFDPTWWSEAEMGSTTATEF
jgi:hypothetical protein